MFKRPDNSNADRTLIYLQTSAESDTCLRKIVKDSRFKDFLLACASRVPKELTPILKDVEAKCTKAREELKKQGMRAKRSGKPLDKGGPDKISRSDVATEIAMPQSLKERIQIDSIQSRTSAINSPAAVVLKSAPMQTENGKEKAGPRASETDSRAVKDKQDLSSAMNFRRILGGAVPSQILTTRRTTLRRVNLLLKLRIPALSTETRLVLMASSLSKAIRECRTILSMSWIPEGVAMLVTRTLVCMSLIRGSCP